MGRVVAGAREVEMGNQSTGTESVVSIALASPFDERNILTPSIIPQWLKLVRLNGETRIHHLIRKGPDRSKSSTGKRSAQIRRMLRLDRGKGREALPICTRRRC